MGKAACNSGHECPPPRRCQAPHEEKDVGTGEGARNFFGGQNPAKTKRDAAAFERAFQACARIFRPPAKYFETHRAEPLSRAPRCEGDVLNLSVARLAAGDAENGDGRHSAIGSRAVAEKLRNICTNGDESDARRIRRKPIDGLGRYREDTSLRAVVEIAHDHVLNPQAGAIVQAPNFEADGIVKDYSYTRSVPLQDSCHA